MTQAPDITPEAESVQKAQQLFNYYAVEVFTYGASISRLQNLEAAWVNLQTQSELAELKGEKGGADCNGIATPTPLDDPRVKALVEAAKAAEAVLAQYYVGNRAIAKRKLRKALSAMEENK